MKTKAPTYREISPACGMSMQSQEVMNVNTTGDIRSEMPVFDQEKCIKCKQCILLCPEGCIIEDDDGKIYASMTFCKGCGICAYECPVKAIEMVLETTEK